MIGKPFGALLQDGRHPVERFDVVVQRRAAEQADLGDIGRAIARIAALALNGFDHRRLFTANIRTGAAAQLDVTLLDNAGFFEREDLVRQNVKHGGILVPHVKIDAFGLHGPGADQSTLEHLVRIALEVIAILEGAGLAFVAVDGHQPRTRKRAYDLPLLAGGEARAAETAQAGVGHLVDDVFDAALSVAALLQHGVAALCAIGGQIFVIRDMCVVLAAAEIGLDALWRGVIDETVPDLAYRRRVAAPHARRLHHTHLRRVDAGLHRLVKRLGALDGASDGIAYADRRRWWRCLALLHHVEMRVEGRDLVGCRLRQLQLVTQRAQVPAGDAMIAILNQMKVFDEEIVTAGTIAQQFTDLLQRGEVKLPSLRETSRTLARSDISCGPIRPTVQWCFLLHSSIFLSDRTEAQRKI